VHGPAVRLRASSVVSRTARHALPRTLGPLGLTTLPPLPGCFSYLFGRPVHGPAVRLRASSVVSRTARHALPRPLSPLGHTNLRSLPGKRRCWHVSWASTRLRYGSPPGPPGSPTPPWGLKHSHDP
jgi:hypothetical protein